MNISSPNTPNLRKLHNIESFTKIIKAKIDQFNSEGFENIVLAGHSMGGWASLKFKTTYPDLIRVSIGLHPGSGGTKKNRRDWPSPRSGGISEL